MLDSLEHVKQAASQLLIEGRVYINGRDEQTDDGNTFPCHSPIDGRLLASIASCTQTDTVWVNCYDEGFDMNFPFGGYKQSDNGRDNSTQR